MSNVLFLSYTCTTTRKYIWD